MLQAGQLLRVLDFSAVKLAITGLYFTRQVVYFPFEGMLLVLQFLQLFLFCVEFLPSGDHHVIFAQPADNLFQLMLFISNFKVDFLQLVELPGYAHGNILFPETYMKYWFDYNVSDVKSHQDFSIAS